MSLSVEEKQEMIQSFGDVVELKILKSIKDCQQACATNTIVVCGVDGQGGLKRDFREMKTDIDKIKLFNAQVKTIAFTILPMIQGGITIGAMWLKSWISGR